MEKLGNKIFELGFILFTFGILFSVVKNIIPIPLFYPGLLLIIFYTIIFNPNVFVSKTVLSTIVLYIVLLIFDLKNHFEKIPQVHLEPFGIFQLVFAYFATALFIENFLILRRKNPKFLIRIGMISLWQILIMSAFTIISESYLPGISRRVILVSPHLPAWVTTHSFGVFYGLPFIIAAVISNLNKKSLAIIFVSIMAASILVSGFLTSLLFAIFTSLFAVIFRIGVKKPLKILLIISTLFIIAFSNFDYLFKILPQLPNKIYLTKLTDLTYISKGGLGIDYLPIRGGVYELSIISFINDPLLGTGNWLSTGEHSYWLDRLAFLGIIGTFFFFITLFLIFKKSLSCIEDPSSRHFYRYYMMIVFFLLFFNPFYNMDFWYLIFIYVPLIINYFDYEKASTKKDKKLTSSLSRLENTKKNYSI